MDTKFTPGPWKAVRKVVAHVLSGPDGAYTCHASFVEPLGLQVYGPDWEHNKKMCGPDSDYICANARLIAAAPTIFSFIEKMAAGGDTEAIALMGAINGTA